MTSAISIYTKEWLDRLAKFDIELRNCPGLECQGGRTLEVNEFEGSGICRMCGEQYFEQQYVDFKGYKLENEEDDNHNDDISRFKKPQVKQLVKTVKMTEKVNKEFGTKQEKQKATEDLCDKKLDSFLSCKNIDITFPAKTKTCIQDLYVKYTQQFDVKNINHYCVYLSILHNCGEHDPDFQHFTIQELSKIFDINRIRKTNIDISKSTLIFNKKVKTLFPKTSFSSQIDKNWKWLKMTMQNISISQKQIDLVDNKIQLLKSVATSIEPNFIQAKSLVGACCCVILKSRHFITDGKKRSFNCTSLGELLNINANSITNQIKTYYSLIQK